MKKTIFVTIMVILALASVSWGQQAKVINWKATGNGSTAAYSAAAYGFHTVTWTKSGTVSACTFAIQQATTFGGSYTTLGATSDCSAAGSYTYYGTANYVRLNVSSWTGTGSITFAYTATVAGVNAAAFTGITCGSSATCAAPANVTAPMKFATGTAAMSSATSVNISGISPAFTSATSFSCTASNANGHAYTSGVEITSSSAITLVSGTSNSDTWIWQCIGY